jgi:hypothetical protein
MEKLKTGTKIFEINNGWGYISEVNENNSPIYMVTFESESKIRTLQMSEDGKIFRDNDMIPTVSLTEYDLINGGFTPLSDYNKPKKFDVGYFWDYEESGHELFYSQILKIEEGQYITSSSRTFKNFSKEVPEWFTKRIKNKN